MIFHNTVELESFVQKISPTSKLGNDLANLLTETNGQWNLIVAHSQGSLIMGNAMETLTLQGFRFSNTPVIKAYGSAGNRWYMSMLSRGIGATRVGGHDRFLDLVGNVIGLNSWNPFRFAGSIVASPTLDVSSISPHSTYRP